MDWGEKRRYEEPRPIYLNKDNIGGMNVCHKEDGDFTAIWTKEERPVIYLVKETPEEILAMPDIEEGNKAIDWEQRRYELMRDFISARISQKEDKLNYKEFIEICDLVDIVIKKLKKIN